MLWMGICFGFSFFLVFVMVFFFFMVGGLNVLFIFVNIWVVLMVVLLGVLVFWLWCNLIIFMWLKYW